MAWLDRAIALNVVLMQMERQAQAATMMSWNFHPMVYLLAATICGHPYSGSKFYY